MTWLAWEIPRVPRVRCDGCGRVSHSRYDTLQELPDLWLEDDGRHFCPLHAELQVIDVDDLLGRTPLSGLASRPDAAAGASEGLRGAQEEQATQAARNGPESAQDGRVDLSAAYAYSGPPNAVGTIPRILVVARRAPTLIDHAEHNLRATYGTDRFAGVKATVKGAQACAIIVQYAIAAEALSEWPTQAAYSEYWKITDRTAQREWALFRKAFPSETSPERLARWLRAEVHGRMTDLPHSVAAGMPAEPALALA